MRSPGRRNFHAWKNIPGSGAETTSYTVVGGGLFNGETYDFQVRAVNGTPIGRGAHVGAGPASDVARVTVGRVPPAAAGVTVSALEVTVPEGGTASYTVALESRPSASVTIAVAKQPGGDDDLRAAPASLEFTPSNWDAAQTVTVDAAGDEDVEDGRAVFAHTATSGDSAYRAIEIASVTAVEQDTTSGRVSSSDAGVTIFPKSLTMNEHSHARYRVVLDSKPRASVTIAVRRVTGEAIHIAGSDPGGASRLDRYSLTFTPSNWDTPQPVWLNSPVEWGKGKEETVVFSHNAHSEDEGYDGIAIDRLVAVQQDLPEDSNYSNLNKVFVRENTTTVGRIVDRGHGDDMPFLGYSIEQGDAGRFKVTRDGVLMFKNPPDFEAPTDSYTSVLGDRQPERERFWSAARDNVYILRFRAFLDVSGAFGTEVGITVMVQVMDEPDGEIVISPNAAPEFDTDDAFSVSENTVSVGTVSATDADEGDSITGYAITGGADRARFSIDGTTGALRFAAAPDYENPADDGSDNAYAVEVTATGGSGERAMTVAQTITVTVTNVTSRRAAPCGAGGFERDVGRLHRELDGACEHGTGHHGLRRAVSCWHLRGVGGCRARGHGPHPDADGAGRGDRLPGAGTGDERRGHGYVVRGGGGRDSGLTQRGAGVRHGRCVLRAGEHGVGGHGFGDGCGRRRRHHGLRDYRRGGRCTIRHRRHHGGAALRRGAELRGAR